MRGGALLAVALSAGALLAVTLLPIAAAQADSSRPQVKAPFECGQTWYARTYRGHPDGAVDWNLAGSGEADHGQPVLAGASGIVSVRNEPKGYGSYVTVDHGGGWESLYAHLSSVTVRSGQRVGAETVVGRVGRTGRSDGSHLHHEQLRNGVRQAVVIDGAVVRPTTNSRGASYQSGNCALPDAAVELFDDVARTRRADLADVAPAATLFARVSVPLGDATGAAVTAPASTELAGPDWTNSSTPRTTTTERTGQWIAEFTLRAPNREGDVAERFQVNARVGFTISATLRHHLRWAPGPVSYSLDRDGRVPVEPHRLHPGQSVWVRLSGRNTGTLPWTPSTVLLGNTHDAASPLHHPTWHAPDQPGPASAHVGPGGSGTFLFRIHAPDKAGDYAEHLAPRSGARRCESSPVKLAIRVLAPVTKRLAPGPRGAPSPHAPLG